MGIPNVSDIRAIKAPAIPVPFAASKTAVAPTPEKQAEPAEQVADVQIDVPPPLVGFQQDVEVGEHEGTGRKVYDFVDPDSGETVVQIPAQAVLDLVAVILRDLEAQGRR
jgi:hypothetical protein